VLAGPVIPRGRHLFPEVLEIEMNVMLKAARADIPA